jgi:hypothetical protein
MRWQCVAGRLRAMNCDSLPARLAIFAAAAVTFVLAYRSPATR